jgi:hypothetical protein
MSSSTVRCATVALAATALALPPAASADEAQGPSVQPVALVQLWATAWDQDQDAQADPAAYGDPEDDPGFKIRRARIGAQGDLGAGFTYEVVLNAGSPYDVWKEADTMVHLHDANIGWSRGGLELGLGQQKVPYSREALISSSQIVFTERAVATEHMVPDRETGLTAAYRWNGLGVDAGIFNGSGSFLGDDNIGFLTAGRLSYTNADNGQDYLTWGEIDGLVFGAGANGFYNDDLSTSTLGAGGDIIVRVAGLSALLEGHWSKLQPTATDLAPADVLDGTPRLGLTGQLGYSLGDFENALRFSMYDDDMDTEDNGDVWEIYGGTTVHLAEDHARVGIGYVHRHEMAGQTMANDTIRLWVQGKY